MLCQGSMRVSKYERGEGESEGRCECECEGVGGSAGVVSHHMRHMHHYY